MKSFRLLPKHSCVDGIGRTYIFLFLALIAFIVVGCAGVSPPSPFAIVTISELRTDPTVWTGRTVEVAGVLNRGTGPMNPSSLSENCSGNADSVLVLWDNVPGVRASDKGAKVKVRGVFRMGSHVEDLPGQLRSGNTTLSAAAGTLENVSILWRLAAKLPRCHLT